VWRPNLKILARSEALSIGMLREKEDRIMRKNLKELKPVPNGVERLEFRALVQGEGRAYILRLQDH
jgi:hypothetical protein